MSSPTELERASPQDPAPTPGEELADVVKGTSSWAVAWRMFKKDRVAMVSLLGLVVMGSVALLSPLLANSKPIVASYQGQLFFPAFKDYLDRNFPIPFGIPDALRSSSSFFSPAYKEEIERPDWQTLPDWRSIREEIDRGEAEGWYLSAPIPYYYDETSSGIKLLSGMSVARLELEVPGEEEPEVLEFVPRRPAESEYGQIRRHVAEGQELRARIEFDEGRYEWVVLDASTVDYTAPRGWNEFQLDPLALAGEVDGADRSLGRQASVAGAWEWRSAYMAPEAELRTNERTLEDAVRRWARRSAAIDEVTKSEWTEVAGWPAIAIEAELERGGLGLGTDLPGLARAWMIFTHDRVLTLVAAGQGVEGRSEPLEAMVPELLASVEVSVPQGTTKLDGEAVYGARVLEDGDELTLAGVEGTFHVLPSYVLGTDSHGRSVASRLIHGAVIAGSVGIVSVGIYVIIGIVLGALAGYYRGWVDLLISRLIEVVICFPTLFLIIMIVGFWERSIYLIMIALGLIRWTGVARLVRGEFLKVMSEDYVNAARALGLSNTRIIFRHVLPNAIAPVFVSASFGVAGAILVETSLSFLGFGVAPPTASWGEILRQGQELVNEDVKHLIWAPGICIFLTVTMFNLVGEGLRDALDPKLRT